MKKIIFVCLSLSFVNVFAQDKKIDVGLGIGVDYLKAIRGDGPGGDNGPGFNRYVYGLYNMNNHLSVGLEYNANSAVIGYFSNGIHIRRGPDDAKIVGILAKTRYTFFEKKVRPFLGGSVGLYKILPGNFTVVSSTGFQLDLPDKTNFGYAFEFGVKIGSFTFTIMSHKPGKISADVPVPFGNGAYNTVEATYKFTQISFGWNFGLIEN